MASNALQNTTMDLCECWVTFSVEGHHAAVQAFNPVTNAGRSILETPRTGTTCHDGHNEWESPGHEKTLGQSSRFTMDQHDLTAHIQRLASIKKW